MLAQFVHGIGFTPMFTLGTAYIDDNAKAESTAVYLGLIYAITVLGIAAGYVGGGQFLNLWVDFDRVDTTEIYRLFRPTDPVWIGAWWVGFIVTAILFFLFAIPILSYPKNLPGTASIQESRIKVVDRKRMAVQKNDYTRPLYKKLLDFPKSILVLLKIPTYLIIILGACAETLITGGFSAFAPKVLEEKFDISPADAGIIMGGVALAGGAGGMVLGGVLIKVFKLSVRGMLRLCGICSLLAISVGAGFFINCPEVPFAGLNKYVLDGGYNPINRLISSCNVNCNCSMFIYEPVCGANGVTYFSPCHAGCGSDYTIKETGKEYMSCGCINTNQTIKARSGECGETCGLVMVFIILLLLGMLITLTSVTPASMAILRCVPDEHKALGLGLQWVVIRLLGLIPGPVLTGYVLDTSCSVWQDNCGSKGSCFVYDRGEMSWRLFVWWCAVKLFSAATFFISSRIVIEAPPKNEKNMRAEKMERHIQTLSLISRHRITQSPKY